MGHPLAPDRPTVPEVLDRFRAYVQRQPNNVGGSLHIVLEDLNLEDSSVQFCIDWADGRGDVEGGDLARILLSMSRTQRGKIARRCWHD